jgi:hypothetical protein
MIRYAKNLEICMRCKKNGSSLRGIRRATQLREKEQKMLDKSIANNNNEPVLANVRAGLS